MTIYTKRLDEKKEDSESPPPEVISEYVPLDDNKKNSKLAPLVVVTRARAQRKFLLTICLVLIFCAMMTVAVYGSYKLYSHLKHKSKYSGVCGVGFYELQQADDAPPVFGASTGRKQVGVVNGGRHLVRGEFSQHVEIGTDEGPYEKIEVPTIGDTRRSTVLHDFNKNITAIIDKERGNCFIMQLNRTLVMPPQDFWDLLVKLKSGYYIPDAEVVRENYRAITPPISDLSSLGLYVSMECRYFDTYMLVREGEPIAMSKRSACEKGKYCLGEAGTPKMLCIDITRCM